MSQAKSSAAGIIEINPVPSAQGSRADIHLRGSAAERLPRLLGC